MNKAELIDKIADGAGLSKADADKALALFQDVVAKAPGTPEAAQAEAFITELSKNKTSGS